MKRKILAGVIAIMLSIPSQGQFLKKLQENAEQPLKTEAKANSVFRESCKALPIFLLVNNQIQDPGLSGMEPVQPSEIPEFYNFDWKYTLQIKTGDGERRVDLLFKKDASYFGLQIYESSQRYLVVDPKRNIYVLFPDQGEPGITSATRMPDTTHWMTKPDNKQGVFSFNKVGDKSIMGYKCKGLQAENNKFVYTFYISKETEIGTHDFHLNSQKIIPGNFNPNWLEKGMLMQMIAEGKKTVQDNVTLTCIGIEKHILQLRNNNNMSLAKN